MQALFLASRGGGEGSLAIAFSRDIAGEVLTFLAFFLGVSELASGGAMMPLLLRFLLTVDLDASGEVDMSRSGS